MQTGGEELVERRGHSHGLVQGLVSQRTEMLAMYSKLAGHRPFEEDDGAIAELLEEFCEILVDYTAAAHFRLYRFIEDGSERRQPVKELAHKIYPRIVETTQAIVDFNDRYEKLDDELPKSLEEDLSHLGEKLAERIELEDQLIEAMRAPRVRPAS